MHRTDVVTELAGRRGMSLVAMSRKFKITEMEVMQLNLPGPEHVTLICDGIDWSTSP